MALFGKLLVLAIFFFATFAHPDLGFDEPAETQCQKDIAEFENQLDKRNPMAIKSKNLIIDPRGRPSVTAFRDHYFHTCRTSVHLLIRPFPIFKIL